ncbi:DUF222 domain-containing protein [Rhodococcus sp. NPDC054953]
MELDEMLTTPTRVEPWRLDEQTLLALVPELSHHLRLLDALRVRLVHEIHERSIPTTLGASSTQAWLSESCKLTPGQAKRIIATGQSLHNRPEVADAFTSGSVDADQVRAITNLLDAIPDLLAGIDPDHANGEYIDPVAECTQQCTDYLVASAEQEHSADTANRVAALKSMLERDHDADDENEQLNEFFASPTAGGRVRVKGHFDKVTGEQLLSALSALSAPRPGRNNTHGDQSEDPRSAPQRRADALSDIVRHFLDSGQAPGEGGEKPHMTIFVGVNDLATAAARATGNANGNRNQGSDHERVDPPSDDSRNPDGAHDSGCGSSEPADEHRARSYIRRGPSWMPWLGPIGISTAVMISCDATVTAISMDANGKPLDVGTTTRVIPRRIRRALDARDCGCAFPGCGRPAAWTDGHHIHHWSNGGPTKLSNLVLLCRFHHRFIHKGDWQVRIGADGHPPPSTSCRGHPQVHSPAMGRPRSTTRPSPQPKTAHPRRVKRVLQQPNRSGPDHDPTRGRGPGRSRYVRPLLPSPRVTPSGGTGGPHRGSCENTKYPSHRTPPTQPTIAAAVAATVASTESALSTPAPEPATTHSATAGPAPMHREAQLPRQAQLHRPANPEPRR